MNASSRFSAGDLVQVRSAAEILRTLDAQGRYEGLPFMPEMLRYCGRIVRVAKRAHKTCDFAHRPGLRALPRTVHLAQLRCDGSAHAGCQASCLLFWKDAWLKRPGERDGPGEDAPGCSPAQLLSGVFAPGSGPGESPPRFSCQATCLPEFSTPLSPWHLPQYLEDYRSGNVPRLSAFAARAAYRAYDSLVNLGVGLGRPLRALYDLAQRLRGRRARYPGTPGRVPPGTPTPSAQLGLRPGEWVRVKDQDAILATVDRFGRNRGLSFSAEMTPYCGRVLRVLARAERIVDERTGQLRELRNPCILLEGATCGACYNRGMPFCPRASYAFWREIWLERVDGAAAAEPAVAADPFP